MLRRFIHIPRKVFQVSTKSMKGRIVRASINSLSGTMVDFLSNGTVFALQDTFRRKGINLVNNELHCIAGNDSLTQIKLILTLSCVQNQWIAKKDRLPTEEDADDILCLYKLIQTHCLINGSFATVIPNTIPMLEFIKSNYGILFGGTTNYNCEMSKPILDSLRKSGFVFDSFVSADEISRGRPYPDAILTNLAKLGVSPHNTIKLGDTYVDMLEGQAAGCINVGITDCGSGMGRCLTNPSFYNEDIFNIQLARETITQELMEGGADFIIPDITSLGNVISDIIRKA